MGGKMLSENYTIHQSKTIVYPIAKETETRIILTRPRSLSPSLLNVHFVELAAWFHSRKKLTCMQIAQVGVVVVVMCMCFVSNFIANKFSVKNANNDETYVIIRMCIYEDGF